MYDIQVTHTKDQYTLARNSSSPGKNQVNWLDHYSLEHVKTYYM